MISTSPCLLQIWNSGVRKIVLVPFEREQALHLKKKPFLKNNIPFEGKFIFYFKKLESPSLNECFLQNLVEIGLTVLKKMKMWKLLQRPRHITNKFCSDKLTSAFGLGETEYVSVFYQFNLYLACKLFKQIQQIIKIAWKVWPWFGNLLSLDDSLF